MTMTARRVGLDVHARETAAAVLDPATGEVRLRTLSGRPSTVVEWLETVPQPFRAVYEAGPTGYGLARAARARGLDVVVCAPGHIVRSSLDRVKTDKRDAIRLARLLLAGELRLVRVPEPAEEQLRDLVRAREDLRVDLMRCRARIAKFLLRRELYYPLPGNTWTKRHRNWLRGLRFDDRASELAFADALHAHDSMLARRDQLEAALEEIALGSWAGGTVARLRCLRGISTLSGAALTAEVCDFARFDHPRLLASYLGLVPSEDSTGEQRRQGAITKAGSKHARRLLVEAAWHYRRPPRVSHELAVRQRGQDPRVIDIAWRAQRRSTGAGSRSSSSGASATRSSLSRSHASCPPSAGRSPRSSPSLSPHRSRRGGVSTSPRALPEARARRLGSQHARWPRPPVGREPATQHGHEVASPRMTA